MVRSGEDGSRSETTNFRRSDKLRESVASEVMQESTTEKIRAWFEKTGYPLEMNVARAWLRAGFVTYQSEHFRDVEGDLDVLDPDSVRAGKVREIDVLSVQVAHEISDISPSSPSSPRELVTAFVTECKSGKTSKDKPWVLLSRERSGEPLPMPDQQTAGAGGGQAALRLLAAVPASLERSIFAVPERVAYSITRAFTDRDDENYDVPYQACVSAAKAAKYWAWKYGTDRGSAVVVFPVVVTSAPLMQAWLGPEGRVEIAQVDRGVFLWRNPVVATVTRVDVLTEAAMPTFAAEAKDTCDELAEVYFTAST